jgi:hypothetical protein
MQAYAEIGRGAYRSTRLLRSIVRIRPVTEGRWAGWHADRWSDHFKTLAFSLPISTTKQPQFNKEPLKTQFGYHIVMVEGQQVNSAQLILNARMMY